MGNPLGQTNCITRLLWLKSEFDSTLLPLELVVENGMGLGLVGSKNRQMSSWFLLDWKKLHNITFLCPFHICHSSLSNQIYIYTKKETKGGWKTQMEQVCEPLNVNYWFMWIVHYETPTSKVLSKAKHVAALRNIPYSHNS